MSARGEAAGFAERLAQVMDVLAAPPHECSFMQIVRKTGLPRASVHRIVGQLVEIGYLESSAAGRGYRLGARLCDLVNSRQDTSRLTALANPILTDLAKGFGFTSFAARLSGSEVDLFASVTPDDPARAHVRPAHGLRPLHACSSSKAILAFLPEQLSLSLLAKAPRHEFTARTLTASTDLSEEFGRIRTCGYAVCDGEIHDGVVSLAVPVQMPRVGARYALGLIGLSVRLSAREISDAADGLKSAARRLAQVIDPQSSSSTTASIHGGVST